VPKKTKWPACGKSFSFACGITSARASARKRWLPSINSLQIVHFLLPGFFTHRYDDLFGAQIFDLIAAVYETNANVVTSITRIADDLHLHETSRSDYAEEN